MIVPNFVNQQVVDKNGNWTDAWASIISQLLLLLQQSLSDEGFVIPSQSNSNLSNISQNLQPGTILFNTEAQNGLGQLFIRLNDGSFHPILQTN
jgi:hypothetical protein